MRTVEEMRAELLGRADWRLNALLSEAESPIEQMVLLAFLLRNSIMGGVEGIGYGSAKGWPAAEDIESGRFGIDRWNFRVIPQLEIETPAGARYRVDLALRYTPHGREDTSPVFVAIECDGHDYHERTNQQAERDKERDREFQALGWAVARFTGSEIWRDPRAVAEKVFALADSIARTRSGAPP